MKIIMLITFVIIALVSSGTECGTRMSTSRNEASDYAIYSIVIRDIYFSDPAGLDKSEIENIVIRNTAGGWEYPKGIFFTDEEGELCSADSLRIVKLTEVDSMLFQDWIKINREPLKLENEFKACREIILISREEEEALSRDGFMHFWQRFYEEYPKTNGMVILSRISYNRSNDGALLFISHGFGFLGAQSYFVFLEKSGSEWRVIKKMRHYVS